MGSEKSPTTALHLTASASSSMCVGIVSLILGAEATVYEDASLTVVLTIIMPLLGTLLTVVAVELLVVREGDNCSDFRHTTKTENGKSGEEFVITELESRDREVVTGDSGLGTHKEETEGRYKYMHLFPSSLQQKHIITTCVLFSRSHRQLHSVSIRQECHGSTFNKFSHLPCEEKTLSKIKQGSHHTDPGGVLGHLLFYFDW